MASLMKSLVGPKSLTHCVLDQSFSGQIKGSLWRLANFGRVRRNNTSAALDAVDQKSVLRLRDDGIVIGHVTEFLSSNGMTAFKKSDEFIRARLADKEVQDTLAKGASEGQSKNYLIHLVDFHKPLDSTSPLLALALDERLLQIVANYLGMWPQLHAVGSWYNFPVDQPKAYSQLWHRDPEDLKTVKVFIYLDDVGPKQGAFTYIPKTHPLGTECTVEPAHAHPRRVLDHEMEAGIPSSKWLACTGQAGTMIIADTVGYHRGGDVSEGHRMLITFTYTSGTPQDKRKLKINGTVTSAHAPIQRYAIDG